MIRSTYYYVCVKYAGGIEGIRRIELDNMIWLTICVLYAYYLGDYMVCNMLIIFKIRWYT